MTSIEIYYVGCEDSEEMGIEYYDNIFEALASYYEAINEGPEEFNLAEAEIGRYDLRMLNMEPMEYYLFSDSTRHVTGGGMLLALARDLSS